MPSQLHEALLLLFRNRPELAPELLRDALHQELPPYSEARIESAELTELQPAEYRADLVVLLYEGKPVLGIIVEVQLQPDTDKLFSWPAYIAGLRRRMRCPAVLLVVSPDDSVASWAAAPIDLGAGSFCRPFVLGPAGVPVVTDPARAATDPELAVLSAMAHGSRANAETAIQIALAAMQASAGLDADRAVLYVDLVLASLSHAAKEALRTMDPAKYQFQSDFAKHYIEQGRVEGEARGRAEGEAKGRAEGEAKGRVEGRAATLIKLLAFKNLGPLDEVTLARIHASTVEELELWAVRVLTASSLDDVFGA